MNRVLVVEIYGERLPDGRRDILCRTLRTDAFLADDETSYLAHIQRAVRGMKAKVLRVVLRWYTDNNGELWKAPLPPVIEAGSVGQFIRALRRR
jgi:hypothetical protein